MPKNKERTYKAIAYLRISNSDSKEGESESLGNQRSFIQSFVSKNPDIEIVSEKIDDGVTGLVFDRPQFKEMMEEVMEGTVDCIIVKDLSRLGRDYVQTGEHLRKVFPQYGVRFIAILDNLDTKFDSNVSGKLDVTVKTIINDKYSEDISKKTRSALKIKQQNGEYTGAMPVYGYIKSEENKNLLIPNNETADVVREIFSLKIKGFSALRIGETLNARGVLSPLEYKKANNLPIASGGYTNHEGTSWSATTILRILQDSTYIGTLTQGKMTTFNYKLKERKKRPKDEWAIIENAHEPIISKEDFSLVQKLMNLDTRTSPNKDSVYLFSGLMICGCCGSRMVRKSVPRGKNKYVYYACNTGRKNGCTTKMVKEELLTDVVEQSIQGFVKNVIALKELADLTDTKALEDTLKQSTTSKIDEVEKSVAKVKGYKSTLYKNLTEQLISKEEYKDLNTEYSTELSELEKELGILQEELGKISANADEPYWITQFKEFQNMHSLTRHTVVQLLESITISEKIHLSFRYQDEYDTLSSIVLSCQEVG